MKNNAKVFLLIFLLASYGCASFEPMQFNYTDPKEDNNSIQFDSLYISAKVVGDLEKGKKGMRLDAFSQNNLKICAVMICIKNESSIKYSVMISSTEGIPRVPESEVYSKYSSSGFFNFLIWSIPWIINISSGTPIYYGIAFPVVGLAEISNSDKVNNRLSQFIEDNRLDNSISAKKSTRGLIFFENIIPKQLLINITNTLGKADSTVIQIN